MQQDSVTVAVKQYDQSSPLDGRTHVTTTVETLHNGFAGVLWAGGERLARGRGSSNSRLVFFKEY